MVHEGKAPNIYDSIALGIMRGEENRIPEGVNECQRKTVAPAFRIRMHTRTRARFARGQTRKLKHQNNLFQHIRVLQGSFDSLSSLGYTETAFEVKYTPCCNFVTFYTIFV